MLHTPPAFDPADILTDLCDPSCSINIVRSGFPHKVQGLRLGPRTIPQHIVIFVAANTLHCSAAGATHTINGNDLLWVPPDCHHEILQVSSQVNLCFMRFELRRGQETATAEPSDRPSEPRDLAPPASRSEVVDHHASAEAASSAPVIIRGATEVRPIMEQIIQEYRSQLLHHDARLRGLMLLLFTTILRLEQASSEHKRSLAPSQRKALSAWVEQNLAQWPDTEDLSKVVGLSTDYFTRLFRNTYSKAPRAWLMEQRAFRAADLFAESQLSVTEVAQALGYKELFLFSRQFKQVIGMSPREYRAQCRSFNPPTLAARR